VYGGDFNPWFYMFLRMSHKYVDRIAKVNYR
jgi:hypothetical protein